MGPPIFDPARSKLLGVLFRIERSNELVSEEVRDMQAIKVCDRQHLVQAPISSSDHEWNFVQPSRVSR